MDLIERMTNKEDAATVNGSTSIAAYREAETLTDPIICPF